MNLRMLQLVLSPAAHPPAVLPARGLAPGNDRRSVILALKERLSSRRLETMVQGIFRELSSGGQICVFFHNRFGIEFLFGKSRGGRSSSLGTVLAAMRACGFRQPKIYVSYPDERKLICLRDIPRCARPQFLPGFKRFLKGKVLRSALFGRMQPAYAVVAAKGREARSTLAETILRRLGISDMESIVFGNPDTAVIVSPDRVVRIPFDAASEARCRLNAAMLKRLETAPIAGFVPRFLGGGREGGYAYFCERRLPGTAFDGAGKEMPSLVQAATEFMTVFHLQTERETVIDDGCFRRLFCRDLRLLDRRCGDAGRRKRELLERALRKRFLYATCKTVWSHGDCKVENFLFDLPGQVRGVIDWDLSRRGGLPLLDILYLLIYAKSRASGRTIGELVRERCLAGRWDEDERAIIDRYVSLLRVPREFVTPLLVMFWVHHRARRFIRDEEPDGIERTLDAALAALEDEHA